MEQSIEDRMRSQDAVDIYKTLALLPSGLLVLTTRKGDEDAALLVSWVAQAGFTPPSISVALHPDRRARLWLTDRLPFVLNILERGHSLSTVFPAKKASVGSACVVAPKKDRTESGIAIVHDALAYMECQPQGYLDSGDHRLFVATVENGKVAREGEPFIHIRTSGKRY
jgi:flavin reductase (DIM6/NTAB) family NADH-FMN oxidoreductase RutF